MCHIQNRRVVAALRVRAHASCAAILTNQRRRKAIGYLVPAETFSAHRAWKPEVPKHQGIHFVK